MKFSIYLNKLVFVMVKVFCFFVVVVVVFFVFFFFFVFLLGGGGGGEIYQVYPLTSIMLTRTLHIDTTDHETSFSFDVPLHTIHRMFRRSVFYYMCFTVIFQR